MAPRVVPYLLVASRGLVAATLGVACTWSDPVRLGPSEAPLARRASLEAAAVAPRAPLPNTVALEERTARADGEDADNAPLAVPSEPGSADLDASNDLIVAPPEVIDDCEARLGAAGISFGAATLPIRRTRSGLECGAHQAVVYRGVPGGVRWNGPPIVTCGMALAMARFEAVLQEESERHFAERVVRVGHVGTYSCRKMARFDSVSEHSYANAIDVSSFRLAKGRLVSVARHFGKPGTEPRTAEGRFLRALSRRLYDEGIFSVVVTEFFDARHHDHFHLDLARYRVDGTR